jgi:hypothetical protein
MDSSLMIVVVDDRDIGTMIETGVARTLGKMIITYTSQEYGSNVMISQYSLCHTRSVESLQLAVKHISYIFNKTPMLERLGHEVQFFPVSNTLKGNLQVALKDKEFGIHFNPKNK